MRQYFFTLLLILCVGVSCERSGEIYFYEDSGTEQESDGMAVTRAMAGEDPFRLETMQQALDIIAESDVSLSSVMLSPTDYYVKFNPQDSLQMDALEALDIELFNHPLDNKVYTDVESEEDDCTVDTPLVYEPLYSVVPAGFSFPENVEYEIIYPVFIQHGDNMTAGEQQLPSDVYDRVIAEAMVLSGNAVTRSMLEQASSVRIRFEVGDNAKYGINKRTTMPLKGAKVHATYYTYVKTQYTDADGCTAAIYTPYDVEYEVQWDYNNWTMYIARKNKIRSTNLSIWEDKDNVVFEQGRLECALAGMHTALYSYFYESYPLTEGLAKPSKRIRLAVMDKHGRSNTAPIRPRREIYMYCRDENGRAYNSEVMMQTMFHELGHISHNYLDDIYYSVKAHTQYGESWAKGVEYAYMKSVFPEYVDIQYDGNGDNWMYRHVVQSMLNNGFTLSEIQQAFSEVTRSFDSWGGWQQKMKESIIDGKTDLDAAEKTQLKTIIDIIFGNPTVPIFDMRNAIVQADKYVYMNQLTKFGLSELAKQCVRDDQVKITKWEIIDSDGIKGAQSTDTGLFVRYTEPGVKTVRMEANVFLHDMVYERQITVLDENFIILPDDPVVNYQDTLRFQDNLSKQGFRIYDSKCDLYTEVNKDELYSQSAYIKFLKAGERTAKISIYCPLGVMYDYVMHFNVRNPNDKEAFEIVDRPDVMQYDTVYEAKYMPLHDKVTEIEKIEFNHYYMLFYHNFTTWSFDTDRQVLSFSIPKRNDVPFDYILTIYYKTNQSMQTQTAQLLVSNFRS